MKNQERKPALEKLLSLFYTVGLYKFFTKTVAAVAAIVFPIIEKLSIHGADVKTARGSAAKTLVSCIWIVNHMKRKLQGICSISSSVCDNVFCKAWQAVKDCICKFCYAYNQQSFQTGLRERNILNGIILRNVLIPVNAFKVLVIVFPYLRIESFGDVANIVQARNYIRIIKAFPEKRCAVWSKNLAIWDIAFKLEGKPENTTFVASSPFMNKPIDAATVKKYRFIDHVFTVYTKKYARENSIVINCGGRKCLECILAGKACYFRGTDLYINELKK